jgi:hypothetical protein
MKSGVISGMLVLLPSIVLAQDWSGPYGGLSYGLMSGELEIPAFFDLYDVDSQAVGGFVGYNVQQGALV